MVKETDLSWLASFIEAEGSISTQTTIRKNGNLLIVPFVRITNASQMAIDEIIRLCKELNVTAKTYWRKEKHCHNLPICNVRIDGCYSSGTLLKELLPYFKTEKKENAKVLLEFIESRKNSFSRKANGTLTRNGYTKYEVELISSIRKHHSATPIEVLLRCNNIVD